MEEDEENADELEYVGIVAPTDVILLRFVDMQFI